MGRVESGEDIDKGLERKEGRGDSSVVLLMGTFDQWEGQFVLVQTASHIRGHLASLILHASSKF